ncbi:TPA: hypothetical protein ACH3X1_012258 [Trebouxia sp. C0004]
MIGALFQLAFVLCAVIGGIVLYKVFQGSSVESAIRDTKGSIKGAYKEAKGSGKGPVLTSSAPSHPFIIFYHCRSATPCIADRKEKSMPFSHHDRQFLQRQLGGHVQQF